LATITITLTDVEDGVTVKLDSDPSVNWEELPDDATDAHRMAISMLRLYEHAHDEAEKMHEAMQEQSKEGCCDSTSGCGAKHQKEGACARHKHTHPEECCQKDA